MDTRESGSASREAREEVTRRDRAADHAEAALEYLRNIMYAERPRRKPETTRAKPETTRAKPDTRRPESAPQSESSRRPDNPA